MAAGRTCAPCVPTPRPSSGVRLGAARGVDLQPRRPDSREITSTREIYSQGSARKRPGKGRGALASDSGGGGGPRASTSRAGWVSESKPHRVSYLYPPFMRELSSRESWGPQRLLPPRTAAQCTRRSVLWPFPPGWARLPNAASRRAGDAKSAPLGPTFVRGAKEI